MRLSVTLTVLRASVRFLNEFVTFKRLTSRTNPRFVVRWKDRFPCLFEKTRSTEFDRHYIYHTAWAARLLRSTKPSQHVDISSSLYFCTMLSAFIPIRFYDYRPPGLELDDLSCEAANLTALPFDNETIWSLSCMHVAEHVGLGRYGDELDPEGDVKAMSELSRVLARGGSLLYRPPGPAHHRTGLGQRARRRAYRRATRLFHYRMEVPSSWRPHRISRPILNPGVYSHKIVLG